MQKSGEVVDIQDVVNSIEDIDPEDAAACREFSAFPATDIPSAYRAWYSSRPASTAGINDQIPLAEDTIFAKDPTVADALEAIYVHAPDETVEPVGFDIRPVDLNSALTGLKKLKCGKDLGGLLLPERIVITDTMKHVRNAAETAPANSVDCGAESTDTDSTAPSEKKFTENILLRGLKTMTGALAREWSPDWALDEGAMGRVLQLAEYFTTDSDGNAKVFSASRYQRTLDRLTRDAADDPEVSANFFQLVMLLGGKAFREQQPYSRSVVDLSKKLSGDYRKLISKTILDPAAMLDFQGKWLGLIGGLPADRDYSPSDEYRGSLHEVADLSGGNDTISVGSGSPDQYKRCVTMLTADSWGVCIVNSLAFSAQSKPRQAFEHLYSLAKGGLDPTHKSKFFFTLNLICSLLDKSGDMSAALLLSENDDPAYVARVGDLRSTLAYCGYDILAGFDNKQTIDAAMAERPKIAEAILASKDPTPEHQAEVIAQGTALEDSGIAILPRLIKHGNPMEEAA